MSFYEDEQGRKVLLTILETFQIVAITGPRTINFIDLSSKGLLNKVS